MNKNITIASTALITVCALFIGILVGVFIGRITDKNPNSLTNQKQFKANQTGKINVNTASAEELTMLPGIGEETAKRIIEYRTKYGIFFSLDELTKVKGIGENTVEKLKPYATVRE